MFDSSSNSLHIRGSFPNKFSFSKLASMPSLHVSLKAVMRSNIIMYFFHNFQSVSLNIPAISASFIVGLTKSIEITAFVP